MSRQNMHDDDEYRKPDLVNNMSVDQMRKKINDNSSEEHAIAEDTLMREIHNLPTTETDMLMGHLANKEKMFSDVKEYQKPERHYTESYEKKSDDYENLIKKNEDYYPDIPPPQPSQYGPSYGPTNNNNQEEDKYATNVPVNMTNNEYMTEEEENLAKLDMLRKLGELHHHGVKLSQNYSMKSDLKAMRYEYELHKSIRDKHNGIKWLNNMMLNICYGMELGNEKFNPFDFKLKGWTEQMNDDADEYYDVFGEIYDKYFKAGKPIPPELKLFFLISGSALKFHFTQTMMGSIPTLGDALTKNPQLAEKLRKQAAADKLRNRNMQQHDVATKQAEDLDMLRKKEQEYNQMGNMNNMNNMNPEMQNYMMQNEILRQQQREIEELQRQLTMQRSDSRSMYSKTQTQTQTETNDRQGQKTMKPPTLPASLQRGNVSRTVPSGPIPMMSSMGNPMINPMNRYPTNPALERQELFRQQQIMDQKRMMRDQQIYQQQLMQQQQQMQQQQFEHEQRVQKVQQLQKIKEMQELQKQNNKRNTIVKGRADSTIDDTSSGADSVNYNPDLEEIIGKSIRDHEKDTGSKISGGTNISGTEDSKATGRRGRKPRKQPLRVKT